MAASCERGQLIHQLLQPPRIGTESPTHPQQGEIAIQEDTPKHCTNQAWALGILRQQLGPQ